MRRAISKLLLVLGIGGGGTWYWWSEKQKSEAVARLQKDAQTAIGAGDFAGNELSLTKLKSALEKDPGNLLTFTYAAEAGGLESLLYGTETERVDRAIKAIGKDIAPGDPGERELVIGKAAVELSRLYSLEPEAAVATLGEINKLLDGFLAKHETDKWARWLKGRALLAAGERKAARALFQGVGEGADGLAIAMIDHADLLVDDGQLEQALALYKKANEQAKDHPFNVIGRSIGRAEAAVEDDVAIGELNDRFKANLPPRTAAYRALALALANISIEDYPKALESLRKASAAAKPPGEPRFWARVAWAYYVLGDLAEAAKAREKCVWYSKKPEDDPAAKLVDAALFLASGLPERALDLASKLEGTRPRLLRIYAMLDLAKYKEALGEAEQLATAAPTSVEASIVREQARALAATSDKDRTAGADELERLARKANSKLGRHALGVVRFANGDVANAKIALETALTDVSETSPNPVAYRTLTALAEVALAENDVGQAGKLLDWALYADPAQRPELALANGTKLTALDADKKRTPYADHLKANSGYAPTLALQARVVLRNQEPDRALGLLEPLLKEGAAVTPAVQLTLAEALVTRKGATAKDKEQAKEILVSLKDNKAVSATELGRIAALIDPALPKELDLPDGAAPSSAAPAPAPKKPAKKGRRGR
ncbi:MAG: tetratricopeptide repeat protein [Kofleriaceae bacterium]